MRSVWPGRRQIAVAFLLGAAMALGQAPFGLWQLTLLALAVLFALLVRQNGAGAAAWIGLFAGAGHFALALSWIIEPFLIAPERHGWMAPFAVVLISFGLGLFWALAFATAHLTGRRGAWIALALPLTLTLAELLRGRIFTGFPWAMPGHVWVDTPVAQLAALAGAGGLTLFLALLAVLPVALQSRRRSAAVTLAVLLGAVWFWGQSRLAAELPVRADAAVIRLVQPNAEQSLKWDPDQARVFFRRLLDLSGEPPAGNGPRPDLVVWPETSVPWLLETEGALLPTIAEAGNGAQLAVGIQRAEAGRGWNSLALIGPGADLRAVYDKHHLVPFGEYVPFGDLMWDWFGIGAFASQLGGGYSAGPGPVLLDLGPRLGRALPLICYEAVFPQDLHAAPAGADWILQITNDAWFGTRTGPWQHLAQARLRAVEQGLPFLRAANTGVSAVIDARGRVVMQLELGQMGVLDTPLPPAVPGGTVYARTGDLPLGLAMLAALALVGLAARRANASQGRGLRGA
ncbi:apolipoprotein N-acyltransferase [Szabonella alba]|uniref:Apolipoprotein N-acyltransferase n=1 Tax=Szabonella alba TaxID=2804194 RepID=A0A8K0V6H5_9RHOB|nr:apolipoprotein N-acyltransferase [Szabonella alba]MBL4916268.1 apolipoprotein N-acyltransferase [Szabonella alba]